MADPHIECEVCGGSDLLKDNSVLVCQTCGCKHSLSEVRNMLKSGAPQSGLASEPASTGTTSSNQMIDNYLAMANAAYKNNNVQEALQYCNKVLELNSTNYKAFLIKGMSAELLTSIADNRLAEVLGCYDKALSYAPEEEASEMRSLIKDMLDSFFPALIDLHCNSFIKVPIKSAAE